MAFTNQTLKVEYTCNGSTGPYPVTFHFDETQPSEVKAILTDADGVDTVLTYNTDYFVTDGSLYTVGSYSASNTILLWRETTPIQEVDIRDGDPVRSFNMEERGLDRVVMMLQELKGTALRLKGYEAGGLSELEDAVQRANKLIRFDADGDLGYLSTASWATSLLWSASTAYAVDDLAYYGGVLWICEQAHTNQTPAEGAYWSDYVAQQMVLVLASALYDWVMGGSLSVGGDLDVTGTVDADDITPTSGTLVVTGDLETTGQLDVTGQCRVGGDLDVSGDVEITGKDLTFYGGAATIQYNSTDTSLDFVF